MSPPTRHQGDNAPPSILLNASIKRDLFQVIEAEPSERPVELAVPTVNVALVTGRLYRF